MGPTGESAPGNTGRTGVKALQTYRGNENPRSNAGVFLLEVQVRFPNGPQGKYRTRPVVSNPKLDSHSSSANTAAASHAGQALPGILSGLGALQKFSGDLPARIAVWVLGVHADGLLQVLDYPVVLAQLDAGRPPLVVGLGVAGVQFDGPAEVSNRSVVVVQAGQRLPPVQVSLGIVRLEADDPIEVLNGPPGFVLVEIDRLPVE